MSHASATQIQSVTEVSIERAHEVIAAMIGVPSSHDTGSLLITSGKTAEFGDIHVVIPPLGNAAILPFATHS